MTGTELVTIEAEPSLPDEPSALIRLALSDLMDVARDPRYRIDMAQWHEPDEQGELCYVCLSGAVAANTLKLPPDRSLSWDQISDDASNKLTAIDDLRTGEISLAFETLGIQDAASLAVAEAIQSRVQPMPSHREDAGAFMLAMEDLARQLEEEGF